MEGCTVLVVSEKHKKIKRRNEKYVIRTRYYSENYYVYMYVCMHGHHIIYSRVPGMDQPGKVANPARGQLTREKEYSPVPERA